jgi:hypothetical protein
MSRSRLIFIIFYLTAMLIGTVHLRVSKSRIYYRYSVTNVHREELKRMLGDRELRLEQLINPSAIQQEVGKSAASGDGARK